MIKELCCEDSAFTVIDVAIISTIIMNGNLSYYYYCGVTYSLVYISHIQFHCLISN